LFFGNKRIILKIFMLGLYSQIKHKARSLCYFLTPRKIKKGHQNLWHVLCFWAVIFFLSDFFFSSQFFFLSSRYALIQSLCELGCCGYIIWYNLLCVILGFLGGIFWFHRRSFEKWGSWLSFADLWVPLETNSFFCSVIVLLIFNHLG
jgi:hypothetical protein